MAFRNIVKKYLDSCCTISTGLDNVVPLEEVFDDFKLWLKVEHRFSYELFYFDTTIQQFGRALRYIEKERNQPLIRGRSGLGKRRVEVYIAPGKGIVEC